MLVICPFEIESADVTRSLAGRQGIGAAKGTKGAKGAGQRRTGAMGDEAWAPALFVLFLLYPVCCSRGVTGSLEKRPTASEERKWYMVFSWDSGTLYGPFASVNERLCGRGRGGVLYRFRKGQMKEKARGRMGEGGERRRGESARLCADGRVRVWIERQVEQNGSERSSAGLLSGRHSQDIINYAPNQTDRPARLRAGAFLFPKIWGSSVHSEASSGRGRDYTRPLACLLAKGDSIPEGEKGLEPLSVFCRLHIWAAGPWAKTVTSSCRRGDGHCHRTVET